MSDWPEETGRRLVLAYEEACGERDHLRDLILILLEIDDRRHQVVLTAESLVEGARRTAPIMTEYKAVIEALRQAVGGQDG